MGRVDGRQQSGRLLGFGQSLQVNSFIVDFLVVSTFVTALPFTMWMIAVRLTTHKVAGRARGKYTADDVELVLRWVNVTGHHKLVFDNEGVVLRAPLSTDPDAWTRFKSIYDLVEVFDRKGLLAEARKEITVPVPNARNSNVSKR